MPKRPSRIVISGAAFGIYGVLCSLLGVIHGSFDIHSWPLADRMDLLGLLPGTFAASYVLALLCAVEQSSLGRPGSGDLRLWKTEAVVLALCILGASWLLGLGRGPAYGPYAILLPFVFAGCLIVAMLRRLPVR